MPLGGDFGRVGLSVLAEGGREGRRGRLVRVGLEGRSVRGGLEGRSVRGECHGKPRVGFGILYAYILILQFGVR